MNPKQQAPYERLLALGICQLELVREGRLDELAACQAARAQLMSSLPDSPPPGARPVLERCLVIERHLDVELRRAREATIDALRNLRRAQRAAEGYTPVRRRMRTIHADA